MVKIAENTNKTLVDEAFMKIDKNIKSFDRLLMNINREQVIK